MIVGVGAVNSIELNETFLHVELAPWSWVPGSSDTIQGHATWTAIPPICGRSSLGMFHATDGHKPCCEKSMSNFGRSALIVILISAGTAYTSSIIAQPIETKSQVLARTHVDGKFAHYLESPSGDIDGIVLEDGTVARFAPFKRAPQAAPFRPGDSVRVDGDVASGLTGPYLVHALVTRTNVPTTHGAIPPPPPIGSAAAGPRSHRIGKRGPLGEKGSREDSLKRMPGTGKTQSPSTDRHKRADDILFVDRTSARARKKGPLETMESKARDATTGTGKGGNYSQWGRSQETAGP